MNMWRRRNTTILLIMRRAIESFDSIDSDGVSLVDVLAGEEQLPSQAS